MISDPDPKPQSVDPDLCGHKGAVMIQPLTAGIYCPTCKLEWTVIRPVKPRSDTDRWLKNNPEDFQ